MAKHNANWTPDVDETHPTAPRNRDELVQRNRAKAAPSGVGPAPRTEPADTYAVQGSTHPEDVRAGPGDAGSARSPNQPTTPIETPERRGATAKILMAVVALGVIAFFILMLT
ncbi:hypothetical protein A8B78_11940 [Jannaschia sp. EhC01]|nr:hypothetical protein A8B78_11940 [Jannaschia sp. EhC01]